MSRVAVVAKITAKPGERDALVAALQQALETAAGEPGTLVYALHADTKEADVLWMYELYADQGALDAHMGSPAFKALGPAIGPHLAGMPELHFSTPVGGKGLPA